VNYLPPIYPVPAIELMAAKSVCPADLDSLSRLLARDLPSYTNRVMQRRKKKGDRVYSSVVAAGNPESTPIPIVSREYSPVYPSAAPSQLFITTLERQYTDIKVTQLQQFHWLFLAKTRIGWRLVTMYSRLNVKSPSADRSIVPPTESSNTAVGEAVRLWLKDCYAGGVRE
jgi:hypothetical protein